jgi:hypothetical protein
MVADHALEGLEAHLWSLNALWSTTGGRRRCRILDTVRISLKVLTLRFCNSGCGVRG